jgi:hypothetical protein
VCILHTHTNKENTLIANSLLNECYSPLHSWCYVTFRAEFTGHNSVLFVIALILVALSSKMCCCSLVLCAPHFGVSRNLYYVIIWAAVVLALMLLIVVKKLWYLRQQIVAVLPTVLWQHLTLAAVQLHILSLVLADWNKEVVVVFWITTTCGNKWD